jgi:uncharacterized membrane protein YhaH (DUF805 family)
MQKPPINNFLFSCKGRMDRMPYFTTTLPIFIITFLMSKMDAFVAAGHYGSTGDTLNLIFGVIGIFFAWLMVFATVKRLRDLRTSLWMTLVLFIPLAGFCYWIYLCFAKSRVDAA